EHGLAECVVELVGARVQQVLAFQVEALVRGEALGARERRRAAGERAPERVELLAEGGIALRVAPAGLELVERRDQRLRDVAAAIAAEQSRRRGHRASLTNAPSATGQPGGKWWLGSGVPGAPPTSRSSP